jgi:hypothetical protein
MTGREDAFARLRREHMHALAAVIEQRNPVSDTYSVIPPPQVRAQCRTCLDEGFIEVEDCTCGDVTGVQHAPHCGMEPCPEGCADVPP